MKRKMWIPGALVVSMLAAGPMLSTARTSFLGPSGQETSKKAAAEQDQASDVGTVTITQSGVGRHNKTTVIRYRSSDFAIVAVTENGKEIPPDRFGRYRDELMKALEYPRTRDFLDRIKAVKKALESKPPMSREQRLQLDKLLGDLDDFLAHRSPASQDVQSLYHQLSNIAFESLARALLLEGGFLSRGEEVRLVLRKSGCALNGRDLPRATSDEILDLWEKCRETPLQAGEKITYIFNPDKEAGERDPSSSVDPPGR